MSLEAMKWALQDAPIPHSTTHLRDRLVLVYLADRHNIDTGVCWPSLGRIADDMGTTKPTVRSAFRSLKDLGLIEEADPGLATGVAEGRKPTVWRLNLDMVRGKDAFTGKDGLTGKDAFTPDGSRRVYPTGKDAFTPEVKTGLPKPKENPKRTQSDEPKDPQGVLEVPVPTIADDFAEWWKAYPRKTAKKAAEKAYKAARRGGATQEALIAGIERSVRSWQREGRAKDKYPYPATWLNQGRWEDEETTPQDVFERPVQRQPTANDVAQQMIQRMRQNPDGGDGWKELGR